MDEQFSQAYKDFMLSDEAQGLQKHLDIRFGTAILAPVMGHDVIVFVTEVEHDPSAACDFYAIFEGSGRPTSFLREDVTVLPSLRDLLRIIEGRWPQMKLHITPHLTLIEAYDENVADYPESDGLYWCQKCHKKVNQCSHRAWSEDKNLMLAAARLAARAVEGKG